MRRFLLPLLTLLAVAAFAAPASAQATVPRVLVVGDSWADYVWQQRTVRQVLAQAGHADKTERGALTAVSGTTAAQWASPLFLGLITTELAVYPTIDVVHLSIGGNDLLGNWNASMGPVAEQALMAQVMADIEIVVNHIRAQRPGIQIVMVGYDYSNFREMAPIFSWGWLLWLYLGSPSPSRMGHALGDFAALRAAYSLQNADVHYIHNYGLMQWFFGYPLYGAPRFAVPFPGQAPSFLPLPGGSADHPSPPTAMYDSFHLNPNGYQVLVANAVYHFYDGWFDANP